jgi:hypothetical protein
MCVYSLFILFTVIVFNMNLSRSICVWQNNAVNQIFTLGWWWYDHSERLRACVRARARARVCGCGCGGVSMIHFNIISLVCALFCQLISSCEIPKPKCYVSFFPMCATWPAHCILHALTIRSTWWRVQIAKLHSKWMGTEWQTVTYLYKIMSSVICIFTRKGDNTLSLWFKLLKG